jgi:hypothetical protein
VEVVGGALGRILETKVGRLVARVQIVGIVVVREVAIPVAVAVGVPAVPPPCCIHCY